MSPELPESAGASGLSPDSLLPSPGVRSGNEAAEPLQAPLHTSRREEADPPSSRHTVVVAAVEDPAVAEAQAVVDVDAVFSARKETAVELTKKLPPPPPPGVGGCRERD